MFVIELFVLDGLVEPRNVSVPKTGAELLSQLLTVPQLLSAPPPSQMFVAKEGATESMKIAKKTGHSCAKRTPALIRGVVRRGSAVALRLAESIIGGET